MIPAAGLLHRLCFADGCPGVSLLFVLAHPDDEVVGAGAQLPRWPNARFIYTTDGAPRDMKDAAACGFQCREDYAAARQRELASVLGLAGFGAMSVRHLGFVDQEASLHLVELVRLLESAFLELQPDVILTHPYEGGHPDHDATAFAVHTACERLRRLNSRIPVVLEMTFYHNRKGMMWTGEFLPCPQCEPVTVRLSRRQREFKQQLVDGYVTQRNVLQAFSLEHEQFRAAPVYDFSHPPHEGRLFYELFHWGMTGDRWRTLAGAAREVP